MIYKKILFFVLIIICVSVVDMELSNISDLKKIDISSPYGVLTFIIILPLFIISQHYLLRNTQKITESIISYSKLFKFLRSFITKIEYLFIAISGILLFQILVFSQYQILLLISVVTISYCLNIFIMYILAKNLFTYYRSNPVDKSKSNRVLLLYAISATIVISSSVFTLCFMIPVLLDKQIWTGVESETTFPVFSSDSILEKFHYLYYMFSILSFIFIWISTVTLMNYYLSRKMKKIYYLFIAIFPLVFYLSQIFVVFFGQLFNLVDYNNIDNIFFYRIIFTISSTVGGILFGFPFIILAKKIYHLENIRNYLILCAFGFILFFVSGSATVIQTPFPPFGIITTMLIVSSSYLILIGLHGTAISIGNDIKIQHEIGKNIDLELLNTLGIIEFEKKIINLATNISDKLIKQTGVESKYTDKDIKEYMNHVLDMMKGQKETKLKSNKDTKKNNNKNNKNI